MVGGVTCLLHECYHFALLKGRIALGARNGRRCVVEI